MGLSGTNTGAGGANIKAPDNAAFTPSGTWVLSWWAELPANASLPGNEMCIFEHFGSSNGVTVFYTKITSVYAAYLALDLYGSGGGGNNRFSFTSATLAGAFNAGLHHFALVKSDTNKITVWLDGLSVQEITGTKDGAGGTGLWGDAANPISLMSGDQAWNDARDFAGKVGDFRYYNNVPWTPAQIIPTIYHAQGRDGITEGLVWRPLLAGPDAGIMTACPDLAGISNVDTFVNNPPYAALQITE
jgi:hypothetical protein